MTEKKDHPQATLLRWIADGKEIQYLAGTTWYDAVNEKLLVSIVNGRAYELNTYRIKPKTIRIGKYDVAEPMKEKLVPGTQYFYITAFGDDGVNDVIWDNHSSDHLAISSQMAWLNRKDALLAAKAIKELLTGQ